MIMTSDGKIFVYGVFGADGCECEFLQALFESEEMAIERIALMRKHYEENEARDSKDYVFIEELDFYGKPELLNIQMLEVVAAEHPQPAPEGKP